VCVCARACFIIEFLLQVVVLMPMVVRMLTRLIAVWGCCVQFRENGCENCPFLEMDREHDNVVNCTTPNFTG
jgi:hypothetical protein